MQRAEVEALRSAEDSHWWHATLRGLVLDVLEKCLPPGSRVLDAGCGTGGMLALLSNHPAAYSLEGIDQSEDAVRHCRGRGLTSVRAANVEDLAFEDNSFEAVLSLDVLYHTQVDEDKAVVEMKRVLRPGGLLLVNAAAFPCLRGRHDVAVCGARRYTIKRLRSLLEIHSLAVEFIHYWNAWLFVPLWIWRSWTRWFPGGRSDAGSELQLTTSWINRALKRPAMVDAKLCRDLKLPFGSSVLAVAKKRAR